MFTGKEIIQEGTFTETLKCYHCGDTCTVGPVFSSEKVFCCEGCKLVFEILEENNLINFYKLNASPGRKENSTFQESQYDYLNQIHVRNKLLTFTDGETATFTLFIPQIHCSSCIWLLENLYKLNKGVIRTTVNFLKREVNIVFNEKETSIKSIVSTLHHIGYKPDINLDSIEPKRNFTNNKTTYYKLGVAFFCFGNIMLLSFPEYFGLNIMLEPQFFYLFGYLNLILSLPILLYAATGFFKSAFTGLKRGRLNMDFPISLGILVMFIQSAFEIISGTGSGYMDTFAGLTFFMLAGRLFQNKSFERLSFERDYKSYFPIAVTTINNGMESSKTINDVKPGDRLLIRNEELIPADGILISISANIDYSFVTGENTPIPKKSGDIIYAGGKQVGTSIEMEAIKAVSQSRLTQLWNENNYNHIQNRDVTSIVDKVSKAFTQIIIFIAIATAIWYVMQEQLPLALQTFTSVLIITCPCALALSYPFALGNSIRILGKQKLFLKNTAVIEKMAKLTDVIFDKTGTLTVSGTSDIEFRGEKADESTSSAVASLVSHSSHPLSHILHVFLSKSTKFDVQRFIEIPGVGISGIVNGSVWKVGSADFTNAPKENTAMGTHNMLVHLNADDKYLGYFEITSIFRANVSEVLKDLNADYDLHVLTGDHDGERSNLTKIFGEWGSLHFNQSPTDKLNFIKQLQKSGKNVLMIGDGLNDAGALRQSDCGFALSDQINNFSPASDGVLDAGSLNNLPQFLKFSKSSMKIIYVSYVISLLYNVVGISFAVQGLLSPLVAAIIMPLSTVTIILFTTVSTNIIAWYKGVNEF